jgi:hypothetical protein
MLYKVLFSVFMDNLVYYIADKFLSNFQIWEVFLTKITFQSTKEVLIFLTVLVTVYVYYSRNLKFIPFSKAIQRFGAQTNCYYTNQHNNIFESPDVNLTQEEYYQNILLMEAQKGKLPIYGYKQFSLSKKLKEIQSSILSYGIIKSSNDNVLYSILDEPLYSNISVKPKDLNKIIKNFKY